MKACVHIAVVFYMCLYSAEALQGGARSGRLGPAINADETTVCTMVDGRETTRKYIEEQLKHLFTTSGASRGIILVDCHTSEGNKVFNTVQGLTSELGQNVSAKCTDMSDDARKEFAVVWTSKPELTLREWPDRYTGYLRHGLHQCLYRECQTKYCAWADSDIVFIPNSRQGWATGMQECISNSMQNIFAQVAFRNESSSEFSSQAFIVDRRRLFAEFLPVSERAMTMWFGSFAGRDGSPLDRAIEGMLVGQMLLDGTKLAECTYSRKVHPEPKYDPAKLFDGRLTRHIAEWWLLSDELHEAYTKQAIADDLKRASVDFIPKDME